MLGVLAVAAALPSRLITPWHQEGALLAPDPGRLTSSNRRANTLLATRHPHQLRPPFRTQDMVLTRPCMLFSIPSGARACHSAPMLLEVVMETPVPVTTITTAFLLIAELGLGITILSSIKTSNSIFIKLTTSRLRKASTISIIHMVRLILVLRPPTHDLVTRPRRSISCVLMPRTPPLLRMSKRSINISISLTEGGLRLWICGGIVVLMNLRVWITKTLLAMVDMRISLLVYAHIVPRPLLGGLVLDSR